jgi:ComF family protein
MSLPRWPTRCGLCRAWGWSRLCGDCLGVYGRRLARCERCALPLAASSPTCGRCLRHPPAFDAALAAVDYAPPWDGLIARYKFHAALDLGDALAERLVEAVRADPRPLPGLLLPAPLSRERLRERGYNQAWELARRVAQALHLPASPELLLRVRHGRQQMALATDERAANVRDAFAVEPTRRAELRGRDVAIVDDVMTTGATAEELARVLREAGAAQVRVWALARTPPPE